MNKVKKETEIRKQKGTLIACGLVAGSAIMDVLLAIPFSIFQSPDALQLAGPGWKEIGVYLGVLSTLLLAWWINRRVCCGKIGH
jgi:Ca2+/Na+ antiporter